MGRYWSICYQILAHQILKTPAIFGRCLHKQRVFERSTSGTHLLLPSWINVFPRDFRLAFQLTFCLYLNHLVFCLMREMVGFSHFSSPVFHLGTWVPNQLSLEAEDPSAVSTLSLPSVSALWHFSRQEDLCSSCILVEQNDLDSRRKHVACAWWTHAGQCPSFMVLTLINSGLCLHGDALGILWAW